MHPDASHHEVRTVSRKTPRDGRLEISEQAAAAIATLGEAFVVRLGGRELSATLARMSCTCAKAAATGVHEHVFIEAEGLKDLQPEQQVELRVEEDAVAIATR